MAQFFSHFFKASSRQIFIIVQLLLTLVITGLLAYQAQDAARSHRMTAEAVLKDYAGLAAREFASSTSNRFSYLGATPVFRHFKDVAWPNLPQPVSLAELALFGLDETLLDDAFQFSFCRFNTSTDEVFQAGQHSRQQLAAFLQTLRQFDYQNPWPFALTFSADQNICLIFRRINYTSDRFEGFAVDIGLLKVFFNHLLATKTLMPISRASQPIDNNALRIWVTGPQGRLFQAGEAEEEMSATVAFDYGLKEMQVSVAVDADMASGLIIGGLPGSRLPLLLQLLLLTVGLIAVSVWLLMRERALSLRQSDSLAAISHELRTPLAQIQMFVETLLLERVRSKAETRRALEIIFGESKRMGDLVENAIRFSSALHGVSKLASLPVDVEQILRAQIEHYRQILADGENRFLLETEEPATILAEPRCLSRMLRNLIDNALKYGPANRPVKLGWLRKDKLVHVWVEDEGEGVPTKYRTQIWSRFTRLPKHRNTAVGGTGVGLWLVRELARAQNARAWVEEGQVDGARFVLAFPATDEEPVGTYISDMLAIGDVVGGNGS